MKILTCNAGYLLGYQNVLGGYVPPPVTSLLGDTEVERRKLEQLASVIDRERPDVVSLLEVDQGSHRTATDGQFRTLVESLRERNLSYEGAAANKYGEGTLVESLPFYSHLGNAVLSRFDSPVTPHYLAAGRKRLVIEVDLGDTVLFAVHLSLGGRSRSRQLDQLSALIARRANGRNVVVTGDFNTFAENGALADFTDRTGLELRVPGETVPARPFDDLFVDSRSLDLFCCSPSLDVERCDVLDVQLSDHRPIVLETTG
ncbi:endonuclease/exonuclease/phosphatase family protein [Natronolimnohabitans innermongolicus]|uniref:Endonuclease/exonuclease/phosphatase n=1 Tax=Natronolimnohabitans innermongolicus JCM 12255 TaxID=1227499 RepID=L9XFY9_9EURY|nr:endonuclease/exonuclease/phosphatase family protein [Natronolimnohabitans innermongolicus]ELY60649.1 endonuclease/exonuclease/phosphatase [Natronolimnohabitans innermongolicus JCM 12255]